MIGKRRKKNEPIANFLTGVNYVKQYDEKMVSYSLSHAFFPSLSLVLSSHSVYKLNREIIESNSLVG